MTAGDRSRGDAALIAALAAGRTVADAAGLARVSEATAYRRLRETEFRQKVEQARSEMVSRSSAQLAALATAAVETLAGLLNAKHDFVQLSAAKAILELGLKLRESIELEQRVSAIEDRLASRPTPASGFLTPTVARSR